MKKLVGVDIGATQVRVVEVAGVDATGKAIVTKIGVSPIADNAIVAGRIKNPAQVALALKRALKEAGVPRRGFILGTASPDIAMTQLALPMSIKKSERESAIRVGGYEVSPTVPLEKSTLASQTVETVLVEGNQVVTLSVAAALQTEIELLKTVCKLAGCQPRAIDLSGAALLRSLTRLTPDSDEVATIVDLGASKVTVVTRKGPHMRSLRTVPGGGGEISRNIRDVTGESPDTVERRKISMRINPSNAEQMITPSYAFEQEVETSEVERSDIAAEAALNSSVEALVESVAQSIEADSALIGEFTQGVTLCGGTARLKGIKERLQHRVGIQVAVGKPSLRIEHSKRNAPFFNNGQEDPAVVMDIAVAVGLALWKDPS